MKLIVGLGNPGKKYTNTRHNVGFLVVNKVAEDRKWSYSKNANAEYLKLDNKVELLKPQTFMNLSGQAVQYAMQKNRVKLQDVLIVCDDLDLPLGTIRVRLEGSSGGHNGLQSIIDHVSNKFARIRVGIGSNRNATSYKLQATSLSAEDYVLQNFSKNEIEIINKSVDKVVGLVLEFISSGGIKEETIKVIR